MESRVSEDREVGLVPDRRDRSQIISILCTAFLLRLSVIAAISLTYPKDWLYTRGMEMGLLANSLVTGHGLSSPFGGDTGPTAFIAPGYPLLVAATFKLLGTYSFRSALTIMMVQTIVNLLAIWLIMRVARELFNRQTSLVAGWISACSLPLLWMPTILWDTSLSSCALIGTVALALRLQRTTSNKLWAVIGAYCGVVGLINPALLPTMFAITGWVVSLAPSRRARGVTLAMLAFVVSFAAWPIRNALVFHAFVPTRTTVGFELWMGNHQGASGFLDESLFPTFNERELADYKQAGEILYTSQKTGLAESYILHHPLHFLKLTLKRAARFWFGSGSEHGSALFIIHATITSALGLTGLIILFSKHIRRTGLLFLIPILLFPIPYYVTHAEFRYRLVLDPMIIILAAYGFIELLVRGHLLFGEGKVSARSQAGITLVRG